MDKQDNEALEHEFDVLMARAGIVVPPDRKAGVFAGFKDVRQMTVLLRQKRTAVNEPSNTFSLTQYIRKA
jgi:hypothetical protein